MRTLNAGDLKLLKNVLDEIEPTLDRYAVHLKGEGDQIQDWKAFAGAYRRHKTCMVVQTLPDDGVNLGVFTSIEHVFHECAGLTADLRAAVKIIPELVKEARTAWPKLLSERNRQEVKGFAESPPKPKVLDEWLALYRSCEIGLGGEFQQTAAPPAPIHN